MNRIKLGFFALGTFGLMVSANAASEVRVLTPEQAEIYEVQAQQTDEALGEATPMINEDASIEARRVSCYARDAFRTTYRVTGWARPRLIQREAVRYCQRMSRVPWSCRALGCQ